MQEWRPDLICARKYVCRLRMAAGRNCARKWRTSAKKCSVALRAFENNGIVSVSTNHAGGAVLGVDFPVL